MSTSNLELSNEQLYFIKDILCKRMLDIRYFNDPILLKFKEKCDEIILKIDELILQYSHERRYQIPDGPGEITMDDGISLSSTAHPRWALENNGVEFLNEYIELCIKYQLDFFSDGDFTISRLESIPSQGYDLIDNSLKEFAEGFLEFEDGTATIIEGKINVI